jgi:hypothetical protein
MQLCFVSVHGPREPYFVDEPRTIIYRCIELLLQMLYRREYKSRKLWIPRSRCDILNVSQSYRPPRSVKGISSLILV